MTKYYFTEDELTALPRIRPNKGPTPKIGDLIVRVVDNDENLRAGTICRILHVEPSYDSVDVVPLDPDNKAVHDGWFLSYFALYEPPADAHEPL